jgi:hypothetical protein
MKPIGNAYLLESGRTFRANGGILGINSEELLTEGYDSELENGYDTTFEFDQPPLTAEERREIADYMIERWKEWAEKPPLAVTDE